LYDWITNALLSQEYCDEALAAMREIMELHPLSDVCMEQWCVA